MVAYVKTTRNFMTHNHILAIQSALIILTILLTGCTDDQGRGAMHEAVSRCFATYPFEKGSAYKRFLCIARAHQHYGPGAVGAQYGLITQVDQASLSIGRDIDSGALDLSAAKTALNWVTTKAQQAALQPGHSK
jgi:hypothetical protein